MASTALNSKFTLWPEDLCFLCEAVLLDPDVDGDDARTRKKRSHRTRVSLREEASDRARRYADHLVSAAKLNKDRHAKQLELLSANQDVMTCLCSTCYGVGDARAGARAPRRPEASREPDLDETQPPLRLEIPELAEIVWPVSSGAPGTSTLELEDDFAPDPAFAQYPLDDFSFADDANTSGRENVPPVVPESRQSRTVPRLEHTVHAAVKGADGKEGPVRPVRVRLCPRAGRWARLFQRGA